MQVSLDADLLNEAIRVITRLAPPMNGAVTFEAKDKKMKLHSTAELSRCTVTLGKIDSEELFGIPTEALAAAVKGRGSIDMSYTNSLLKLKSGAYVTSLTTLDALEPEIEDDKSESKTWEISAETLAILKGHVQAVGMKAVANMANSIIPVSVRLTKKGAFIACYDPNRMCFITDKELTGDLDVTLPLDMLNAVLDAFKGTACTMKVTDSLVFVKNPVLDVVLALPASDEDVVIDTDMVQEKAREVKKAEGETIETPKKEVLAFMDNARAVATKERSELTFKTEQGKLRLGVKTTNGTSQTRVKAAVNSELGFKLDFDFFDETLRKCPDQLFIKLVEGAFIMIRAANNTYSLIALNQDD